MSLCTRCKHFKGVTRVNDEEHVSCEVKGVTSWALTCIYYEPKEGAVDIHDVERWVEENEDRLRCVCCSTVLSEAGWSLGHYPHIDGMDVKLSDGVYDRRWVYVKCGKCGYSNALWKLVRQLR